MNKAPRLQIIAWSLAGFVCLLAIIAWWQNVSLFSIGNYELFPLLGLLAFSLMWSHYIMGSIRRFFNQDGSALKSYFIVTSGAVLALILLHPGLFYLQLFLDGLGLPPTSAMAVYTDTAARGAIIIGSLSLAVFLSYELHRWFKNRPWWKYVEYANIVAMFAIIYHALTLGGELMTGWYLGVWLTMTALLAAAIGYNYIYDKKGRHE